MQWEENICSCGQGMISSFIMKMHLAIHHISFISCSQIISLFRTYDTSYSPDLGSCDFFKANITIRRWKLETVDEIKVNATKQLMALPKVNYAYCFEKWKRTFCGRLGLLPLVGYFIRYYIDGYFPGRPHLMLDSPRIYEIISISLFSSISRTRAVTWWRSSSQQVTSVRY